MPGRSVPVVLLPRFTSYLGPGTFSTTPIPVAAYDRLLLSFLAGSLLGAGSGVTLAMSESNDGDAWSPCSGSTPALPTPFNEVQWTFNLTKAWLRFDVVLAGANAGLTCYAQGHFELRER